MAVMVALAPPLGCDCRGQSSRALGQDQPTRPRSPSLTEAYLLDGGVLGCIDGSSPRLLPCRNQTGPLTVLYNYWVVAVQAFGSSQGLHAADSTRVD